MGTRELSTLALFSALRYSDFPIVLVNCDPPSLSDFDYFKRLQSKYDFHLVNWPLNSHGKTLDKVFTSFEVENILCIDSDVEILNSDIIDFCLKYINFKNVFGTGFLQFAEWDIQPSLNYKNIGYSTERPYMPLVLLKRKILSELIKQGMSFDIVDFVNNRSDSPIKKLYLTLVNKLINLNKFDSEFFQLNNNLPLCITG